MRFEPLAGVRVVDVTTSLAGPFCTELLAGLGAEVVKVEPPGGGDEARAWGPPFHDGTATMFHAMNAGKRSLALELRRGREILLRLADRADVLVQSLRPGLADERGLGADELRARNPRLVYCTIGAFGARGPDALLPGYDPLAQARAGIVSVTGEAGRPGVRVGVSIVDQTTGIVAALGVVAALHERERSGAGRVVDVSLLETAVSLMGYHLTGHAAGGPVPGRHGTAFPSIAPYETFTAADGELMVAAANDRLFASLCRALGLDALPDDERFATNPERVAHRDELHASLAARFAERTRAEWLALLAEAAVPAAPVNEVPDVLADPQVAALDLLQELGGLPVVRPPLSADGEPLAHRAAAPELGADTRAILRELGYDDAEIDAFERDGVVRSRG